MPTVSVIVPNYNHAKFLPERLESIFNQTYTDFEVILLDDSSTDNSRSVIDSFKDHPKVIHTLYNEKNSGSTFRQWQKGFELAKGKYVWIAESDDIADPDFLKILTGVLEEYPSVGIAYCQSQVINASNNVLYNNEKWTRDLDYVDWSKPFQIAGEDAIRNMFIFKNIIPNASAVLFRSELVKNLTKDFTRFRYTGDWMVWIAFLRTGNLYYTPLQLNKFRFHENVTRKRTTIEKNAEYLLEIYSIHLDISKKIFISADIEKRSFDYLAGKVYREMGIKKFFVPGGFLLLCKLQTYDRLFFWRLFKYVIKRVKSKLILL